MSSIPLWGYGAVIGASLAMSLVLTPVALSLAVRLRIFDHPSPTKAQGVAVPYLGGAAIVTTFAVVVIIATAFDPPSSGFAQLGGFMGLGLLLAGIGLLDDLRGGLGFLVRLCIEVGAGACIYFLGDSAHLAGFPGWANAIISVIWIVGVTNAFNLLDNMDGLSAGIASLSALTIFGVACIQQRYLVAALAIALAGCALGFLYHNFHPAKIYMGDAGSLFLGFVLAVLLLKLRGDATTRVPIAVILAIPGVALFDTLLVVLTRISHRRSPFSGGRDHTSHRLVKYGFSIRQAVSTIYAGGVILDGSAILMAQLGSVVRIAGIVGFFVLGLIAIGSLARAPVYDEPWARPVPLDRDSPMAQ